MDNNSGDSNESINESDNQTSHHGVVVDSTVLIRCLNIYENCNSSPREIFAQMLFFYHCGCHDPKHKHNHCLRIL